MATVLFEDAIQANNREFEAAMARGDASGMAAAYTEVGQVLPPNGEIVIGRTAIQSLWQGVINSGVRAATLETVELEGNGDTAYEVGKFTLKGAESKVLDHGKYIVIWKQEGRNWRWHRDIFNSNLSAQS